MSGTTFASRTHTLQRSISQHRKTNCTLTNGHAFPVYLASTQRDTEIVHIPLINAFYDAETCTSTEPGGAAALGRARTASHAAAYERCCILSPLQRSLHRGAVPGESMSDVNPESLLRNGESIRSFFNNLSHISHVRSTSPPVAGQ